MPVITDIFTTAGESSVGGFSKTDCGEKVRLTLVAGSRVSRGVKRRAETGYHYRIVSTSCYQYCVGSASNDIGYFGLR